jgi:hypothetical protein
VLTSISPSIESTLTLPVITTYTQTVQPVDAYTPTQKPSSSTMAIHDTTSLEANIGCGQPSDDYTIITINDHLLNQRTFDMLVYAAHLYQGSIDITGSAITQGSYTDAVSESFHTHAGGGAVDISVMALGTYDILYDEIDPLIHALRLAGFAAWFRDFNDLYEGSPVHIHAIAIGDRDLSLAAREQLAGPFGYFWGFNGLPQEDNIPHRDPHGGPIVCDWMIEMGYPNKTATPAP